MRRMLDSSFTLSANAPTCIRSPAGHARQRAPNHHGLQSGTRRVGPDCIFLMNNERASVQSQELLFENNFLPDKTARAVSLFELDRFEPCMQAMGMWSSSVPT